MFYKHYGIALYILRMTPRERWKWAQRLLKEQWRVRDNLKDIADCFFASKFEVVRYCVDTYGMLYAGWDEKYVFVKRRKGDSYGYRVSQYGVKRVLDWSEMD